MKYTLDEYKKRQIKIGAIVFVVLLALGAFLAWGIWYASKN